MKKTLKLVRRSKTFTLGDLVVAVRSSSRNSIEAAAAIQDLFDSGRVTLPNGARKVRVIV